MFGNNLTDEYLYVPATTSNDYTKRISQIDFRENNGGKFARNTTTDLAPYLAQMQ